MWKRSKQTFSDGPTTVVFNEKSRFKNGLLHKLKLMSRERCAHVSPLQCLLPSNWTQLLQVRSHETQQRLGDQETTIPQLSVWEDNRTAGPSELTSGILRNLWCLFCLIRRFFCFVFLLLSWMFSTVFKASVDSHLLRLLTRLRLKDRALRYDLNCTLSRYGRKNSGHESVEPPGKCMAGKQHWILLWRKKNACLHWDSHLIFSAKEIIDVRRDRMKLSWSDVLN